MQESAGTHVKQTPGRRRPGTNTARASTRKNYASENDAAAADNNFQPDFASRPRGPKTPQKGSTRSPPTNQGQGNPAANPAPPASAKSSRRNGNRNTPKNISTSPAPAKPGRRTPPQSAKPAAASTLFAGATFHASPAPSSLPLPSFLKPASPDTPRSKIASSPGRPRQEPSPPASDSEVPPRTTRPSLSDPVGLAAESPLDMLFRADRAEKNRVRRTSSANASNVPIFPLSPPAHVNALPDHGSHTFPRNAQQLRGPPLLQGANQSPRGGISAAELNGNPNQPIGPAFATPFQERMRAARTFEGNMNMGNMSHNNMSHNNMSHIGNAAPASAPVAFRDPVSPPAFATAPPSMHRSADDRSEALMRFLKSRSALPAGQPTASGPAMPSYGPPAQSHHVRGLSAGALAPGPSGFAPSAFQNIYAQPPASNGANGTANSSAPNITAMETSLRQILRLGGPLGAGAPPPGQPYQG